MESFVAKVTEINAIIGRAAWGPCTLILLTGAGVYFTLGTGFLQVRAFSFMMKNTILSVFSGKPAAKGSITPFQALTTALAATLGTGNIVGVATAITLGGPGAVFWMWVSAFFGMMTKYAEIVLAVRFRTKNAAGEYSGGPMYYIERGLKTKRLAALFAVFGLLAAFGTGNMTQVNSISGALEASFGVRPLFTGIAAAAFTALVLVGGVRRIAAVTETLVPLLSVFYFAASLMIILLNAAVLPEAFCLIFSGAFRPSAAAGGFAGATVMAAVRRGVSRGVFSNEAGLGSAPIAHACADVDDPVKQGMWGVFEVFADTIVLCTCTALVILVTGAWKQNLTGAALAAAAFSSGLHSLAGAAVSVSVSLFALSTIVSWSFYGAKCLEYLAPSKRLNRLYSIFYSLLLIVGATGGTTLVWDIADTLNGLMAFPNLIAIFALSDIVFRETRRYFGKNLGFDPKR